MRHGIDRYLKGPRIIEERRDILKDDAFAWEIWDVPNFLRKFFDSARAHKGPFVRVLAGIRATQCSQS